MDIMDKNKIIQEIITYLRINKTDEISNIPFDKVFGKKYDYSELTQFIKENISYVEYDDKKYNIGVWYNTPGLFYLISD